MRGCVAADYPHEASECEGQKLGGPSSPPVLPPLAQPVIQHIRNGLDEAARRRGFGSDNGWNLVWGSDVYLDDIVLLVETGAELQEMLDVVGHYAQEWRFRFNAQKSKTMVVGANNKESWLISREQMVKVTAFKYLGVWLDQKMRENVQMERMREKAEKWA